LFGIRSPSYVYFSNELLHKSGRAGLIALSLLNNATLVDVIDTSDVELHFSLLNLLSTLSMVQKDILATFLQKLIIKYENTLRQQNDTFENKSGFTMSIPTSLEDIRSKYIGGINSLWTNLPHPQVYGAKDEDGNHYAWVNVSDCIAHFLASGGKIITENDMSKRTTEKRLMLLKNQNDTVVIFLQIWSDGFEPNSVKTNRMKGIWVLTITILSDMATRGRWINTFPIGLCRTNNLDLQDILIRKLITEVNELSLSTHDYYYKHESKVVKVIVCINNILQDQPERRKRYYILMGNSPPCSRWMYLAPDIKIMLGSLPPCSSCESNMRDGTWKCNNDSSTSCKECYNWDTTKSSNTIKLTHKYLLDILQQANHLCTNDLTFTYAQLKSFLTAHGLNNSAAECIYDHCRNRRIKNVMNDHLFFKDDDVKERVNAKITSNKHYEYWEGSPLWSSLTHDIDDVVDVPMHLLFLGIVKSTIGYVSTYLKSLKLSASFESLSKRKLSVFQEYGLSWFVMIPFKSSSEILDTTGWVGENFLAFARIYKWYISTFRLLSQNNYQHHNLKRSSTHPVDSWTKDELLIYCEKHEIPFRLKMKRKTLIRKVKESYIPEQEMITNKTSSTCEINDVIDMVVYLERIISLVMGPISQWSRNALETAARLFMSGVNKLCSSIGIVNVATRLWNFQSLMNLADAYERFGPFQSIWEGGYNGEGVIKKIKREKACFNFSNWAEITLAKVYCRRAQGILAYDLDGDRSRNLLKKASFLYPSAIDFATRLSKHHPLSVLHSGQQHYVRVKDKNEIVLMEIRLSFCFQDEIANWYTVSCPLGMSLLYEPDMSLLQPRLLAPAIHLRPSEITENVYCTISYNYCEI